MWPGFVSDLAAMWPNDTALYERYTQFHEGGMDAVGCHVVSKRGRQTGPLLQSGPPSAGRAPPASSFERVRHNQLACGRGSRALTSVGC